MTELNETATEVFQALPECQVQAPKICQIETDAVRRICSGQGIPDLAVAVKELVENSIDAGATRVEVKLKQFGFDSFEVVDNGVGISKENYATVAKKHHTSKIESFQDLLNGVNSFGFRGEALSSLCELSGSTGNNARAKSSLSGLSITTRTKNDPLATKLSFGRDGNLVASEPNPGKCGTSVLVTNLFQPLPVRRKEFKKQVKRQYAKMLLLLQAYGIVSENVKINVVNFVKGKRVVALSTQGKNMQGNLANVFGSKALKDMQFVSFEKDLHHLDEKRGDDTDAASGKLQNESNFAEKDTILVKGYVSKLGYGIGRSTAGERQFVFVNGRPVQMTKVIKTINDTWRKYEMKQKPAFALNLILPSASVDVNVSPDKRQVMMHQEEILLSYLQSKLDETWKPTEFTYKSKTMSEYMTQEESISETTPSKLEEAKKSKTGMTSNTPTTVNNIENHDAGDIQANIDVGEVDSHELSSGLSNSPVSLDTATAKNFDDRAPGPSDKTKTSDPNANVQSHERLDEQYAEKSLLNQDQAALSAVGATETKMKETDTSTEISAETESITALSSTDVEQLVSTPSFNGSRSPVQRKSKRILSMRSEDAENQSNNNGASVPSEIRKRRRKNDKTIAKEMFIDRNQVLNGEDPGDKGDTSMNDSPSEKKNENEPTSFKGRPIRISGSDSFESIKHQFLGRIKEENKGAEIHSNPRKDLESSHKSSERTFRKEDFKIAKVLGQFNLGFIITRARDDLFIMDQHACDEIYRFERLQQSTKIHEQNLIRPLPIELSASETQLVMDNVKIFERNGFRFANRQAEGNGDKLQLSLVAIPHSFQVEFGIDDVRELASLIRDNPSLGKDKAGSCLRNPKEYFMPLLPKTRAMFASRACRGAIMIGTALDYRTMVREIRNLASIDRPWNCPHGRPTMKHLLELDNFYLRRAKSLELPMKKNSTSANGMDYSTYFRII